jgi:hypothetical protein
MKKLLLAWFVLLISASMSAQDIEACKVKFCVSDGVENDTVKASIEGSVSLILSEINASQEFKRPLDLSGMGLFTNVQHSIGMLLENCPLICTDNEIIGHCITTGTGYQVRNIPLMMKPKGEREFGEDEYQEAVINFDKHGYVQSMYLSIPKNLYMNAINSNLEITDLQHRQKILDYVERLRTAYYIRDMDFIKQVFENDSILEVGGQKELKGQYLRNLQRAFLNKDNVKTDFENIEVMRHPVNPNFYGVTLLQGWTNGRYQDKGYLFLLWDFTNADAPQIHVCTWQPYMKGGKPLPKEEVFNLDDFDI